MAIDTLLYARKLKAAGVPPEQAEAMADAIGSEVIEQLTTKTDLDRTVTRIDGSIRPLQWMLGFNLAFLVAITWRGFA